MIDQTVIDALKARGYYIEKMWEVYGDKFNGEYRWMHDHYEGFGEICYSEAEAWQAAYNFASAATA